jgi:Tfp pilus assembly protein PilV
MNAPLLSRDELDRLTHAPSRFDALVAEDEAAACFEKTVTMTTPACGAARDAGWPHHLPGELVIALTGQAGFIVARRRGSSTTAGGATASASSMRASRRPCSSASAS